MEYRKIIKKVIPNALIKLFVRRYDFESSSRFCFEGNNASDVKKDIQGKYGNSNNLLDFFCNNKVNAVHKWHHYIPIYDRYFASFRGSKVRFLEVGVGQGGSLQMWRNYFGEDAILFGIDINPVCARHNSLAGQVRIGSQIDPVFLEMVVKEMGGIDIVLDDGSHHMDHVSATLEVLFPHLSYEGIYMIEDLHTAYWNRFGGGYKANKNFFKYLSVLVDDMHHWYHTYGLRKAIISRDCSGIHIHDSIVVLEKNRVFEPVNSKIC